MSISSGFSTGSGLLDGKESSRSWAGRTHAFAGGTGGEAGDGRTRRFLFVGIPGKVRGCLVQEKDCMAEGRAVAGLPVCAESNSVRTWPLGTGNTSIKSVQLCLQVTARHLHGFGQVPKLAYVCPVESVRHTVSLKAGAYLLHRIYKTLKESGVGSTPHPGHLKRQREP